MLFRSVGEGTRSTHMWRPLFAATLPPTVSHKPAGYLEPEAFGFLKGLLLRVSMTPRADRLAGLIEQTIAPGSVSAQATATGGSLAVATGGSGAAGRACRPGPAAEFRIRLAMSTRSTLSL